MDEEVIEAVQEMEEEESQRLKRGLASYLPMALFSVALHLLLLLIISLIPPGQIEREKEVTIVTVFEEEVEEEIIEEIDRIELEVELVEVEPEETEPVVEEEEVVEVVEEVESLEGFSEDILDLIPDEVSVVQDISNLAVLGLSGGPSGASGLPSGYNSRSGKAKDRALKTGGDGGKTEDAVNAALRWLAEHQEADGSWVAPNYEGRSHRHDSTTAVALLPFLGAGHNEMAGKYKQTVKRGFQYLNKRLEERPIWGKPAFTRGDQLYGNAIILMALSETVIFGSSPLSTKHANTLAEDFIEHFYRNPIQAWD